MLKRPTLIRLCQARDRLHSALDEALPIAVLARESGFSTAALIRQFAAVFGETPHQYRMTARLDRARHLLALGNHSVTDVCMEVGFTSLGSFSTLFAARVGTAPTAYRRRIHCLGEIAGGPQQHLYPGCFSLMRAAFAQMPAT